jgi:competence protein ComEA
MEGHTQIRNIFLLFVFFLLGFLSNVLLVHWSEIDVFLLLSNFQQDTVIEEIPDEKKGNEVIETKAEVKEEDKCPLLVDISGAVNTPGVYCFDKGASVIDGIKKAKGFKLDAGFKYISMKINLATVMLDNSKIYIPFETDYDCKLLTFNIPKEIVDITIPDTEAESGQQGTELCISINSGTQAELETLNGVGPSTALKIINGRPYSKLEDLLNVSGIGEATFNKFKESICL